MTCVSQGYEKTFWQLVSSDYAALKHAKTAVEFHTRYAMMYRVITSNHFTGLLRRNEGLATACVDLVKTLIAQEKRIEPIFTSKEKIDLSLPPYAILLRALESVATQGAPKHGWALFKKAEASWQHSETDKGESNSD